MDPSAEEPVQDSLKVHEPFIKAERIQQLAEVDQDITTLLELTGKAIQCLAKPSSSQGSSDPSPAISPDAPPTLLTAAPLDNANPVESFKTSMNAFLTILHSVDVRLKRQIMSLEESGIISLKSVAAASSGAAPLDSAGSSSRGAEGTGAGAAAKSAQAASLEPNGIGNIGSFEVGWLNSRSNKVERDMEVELWARARRNVEAVAGDAGAGAGGDTATETTAAPGDGGEEVVMLD